MKRRFLILGTALLAVLCAHAIPAKRGVWKTITLSDGTTVKAELRGDEYLHYWQATDGQTYVLQADGAHYERADLQQLMAQVAPRRAADNSRRQARRARGAAAAPAKTSYLGAKKGLIILVEFADLKFQTAHDANYYGQVANEIGFTNSEGHRGSVRDYFLAQSGGQFDLTFDVAGPYTMPNGYAYYGADNGEWKDMRVQEMIRAAIRNAANDVNYANYDWDGDSYVDQVYVLYAGDNQAVNSNTDYIWPHESMLMQPLRYDNKYISTYATGSELSAGAVDGIGTFCHEFSHCLGLMDMYDIDYSGAFGMGSWDVMDNGSYNGGGMVPAGYTSYEKWESGWLTPTELTGEQTVTDMKALSDGGEAYIVYNQANKNEYYLLENRQQTGWDAYLPGSGLLVLHVDYNRARWNSNQINDDPAHQRCTIVPADNLLTYNDQANDPWPYRNNRHLTDTSRPAATLFNANLDGSYLLGYPITDIQQQNGLVSFATGVAPELIDLNGPPVDPTGALLYESFDQCQGIGGNDMAWDGNDVGKGTVTPDLDGWYYLAAGGGDRCVLFGTSSKSGNSASPVFTLYGKADVYFKAAPYGNEDCTLTVAANGDTFHLTAGQWTTCQTTLEGNGETRLLLRPSEKRFFLDELVVKENTETGIRNVVTTPDTRQTHAVYTLDGRYAGTDVSRLSRGIYVVGGRKYVVR